MMHDNTQSAQTSEDSQHFLPPPHDPTKTYGGVHVRIEDGKVCEVFQQPDDGFAMEDRFHPSMVWAEITELQPTPEQGWSAEKADDGKWTFTPPTSSSPAASPASVPTTY